MRGKLRIYLGAAPGVGKTYAMLNEGWRRRERGTDVVVGLVVTHERPSTIAQIRDLEIVPPRGVEYRGRRWEELDVAAVVARRPAVVLVDELAHSNVPRSANEKRWQDIETILAAGIEVISTVNIQHLESLNDVVNGITGITQRETVPDVVVRRADQIELVDMSPEALRRRMAHGNIYAAERVDAALGNYFRPGNLAALRELALLWVADRVEDSLQQYMADHGISSPWETRERVLVALTGAPGGDDLIRRAARMARRTKGELIGLHVESSDGLAREEPGQLTRHKRLLEEMGGSWHEVVGDDIPKALVAFAKAQRTTRIVLGTSRRSRVTELVKGSIINRVVREAKDIDVHVIATEDVDAAATRRPIASAHRRRRVSALAVTVFAICVFVLARGSDAAALGAFLVAVAVAAVAVDRAALHRVEAATALHETDTLLDLADRLARPGRMQDVVEEIRDTLHRDSVALLAPDGDTWAVEASVGEPPLVAPADGEHFELRDSHVVVMTGPALPVHAQRLVAALTAYLEAILAINRLQSEASRVASLSDANDLRNVLLAAVSHDLRTPLASIKALSSGWLEPDVEWSTDDAREFMQSIDADADRLNKLVENLLDMSRLQAGVLQPARRPVGLDEVVPAALASLSGNDANVVVDVPESLPRIDTDPALLERVVANVVDNAIRHALAGTVVRIEAARVADRVDLRIVDRGPGIPIAQREQMFRPFQRLGDTASVAGVGLGLAVAKGFVEAIEGEITVEDTPGGGITMVIGLPISARTQERAAHSEAERECV